MVVLTNVTRMTSALLSETGSHISMVVVTNTARMVSAILSETVSHTKW